MHVSDQSVMPQVDDVRKHIVDDRSNMVLGEASSSLVKEEQLEEARDAFTAGNPAVGSQHVTTAQPTRTYPLGRATTLTLRNTRLLPRKVASHSSRFSAPWISMLVFMLVFMTSTTVAFEFQHDFDKDECAKDIDRCTSTTDMWYKCPISCSTHLEQEGAMAEERGDPEQFYLLKTMHSNGKTVSLEDNEGYVTLFAVLPLLPGMAPYYRDAIEHMAEVYKYTLVPMILPIPVDGSGLDNLPQRPDAKSVMLQNGDASNPVLQYLMSRKVVAGNHALQFSLDRATIFLISHTGMFIERLVAPTMEVMERRHKVHEWAMTKEDL
jgi:hypothetical protein